jgi:S-sulfo-L-cysteine synthase (3-phospho-L-serine-dependent)
VTDRVIHANVLEAIALPRIIRLRHNLLGLAFPLMKLLPAEFIIRKALESGALAPGAMIAETTSGTFGLALAIVASLRHHPLTLVSDPAIDDALQRRLEDLGAIVRIVREPGPSGGFQRARLDLLEQILADHPGSFCPRQYGNAHNPESYAPCAELLAHAAGPIDCLIGTVGSGGSMCGLSSYLRLLCPRLIAIGVDTHGSVIFGQPDAGAARLLRGLGNSLLPPNVDHTTFDWVHWVDAAEAFLATRELHREHALFMGPTSGAAYLVADWWARTNPDALAAVILPDEGYRYQDTVYDDRWLEATHVRLDRQTHAPAPWESPRDGHGGWACYRWGRRSHAEVMSTAGRPQRVSA